MLGHIFNSTYNQKYLFEGIPLSKELNPFFLSEITKRTVNVDRQAKVFMYFFQTNIIVTHLCDDENENDFKI